MSRRRLSQQQRERIQSIQQRRRDKLAQRIDQVLADDDNSSLLQGRIISQHGANLLVRDSTGRLIKAAARQNIGQPVCGDQVALQVDAEHRNAVISALLARKSVLSRPDFNGHDKPLAANISQLLVVIAPEPEVSEYLIDQYLVAATHIDVNAAIVINKCDLLKNNRAMQDQFERLQSLYSTIGYPVLRTHKGSDSSLQTLSAALQDQTSIFVGQSGVGKSSLIQQLVPDLEIRTGSLSQATGLGRHTTSSTTWYELQCSGALIDSPGIRSFRLSQPTRAMIERGFREIRPYIGHCRFSNCRHQQEPGCAINQARQQGAIQQTRYNNFLHMLGSIKNQRGVR
ncbi:MAG: ribosome small subunit-dependent GTPase A [gamma proteobacterium symbiont of Bathyaustriella thionipta]|nr:ribosome small subunit-dependent GTPase A [gamma proteobacterium symbiont of Bathyaustriella thionipta]